MALFIANTFNLNVEESIFMEMGTSQCKDVVRDAVKKYRQFIPKHAEVISGNQFAAIISDNVIMEKDEKYTCSILKSFNDEIHDPNAYSDWRLKVAAAVQRQLEMEKTVADMSPKRTFAMEGAGVKVSTMEDFPAGENVFRHDLFHMGTPISNELMIMHCGEKQDYIILCFNKTGKRVRIDFDKETIGYVEEKDTDGELEDDLYGHVEDR